MVICLVENTYQVAGEGIVDHLGSKYYEARHNKDCLQRNGHHYRKAEGDHRMEVGYVEDFADHAPIDLAVQEGKVYYHIHRHFVQAFRHKKPALVGESRCPDNSVVCIADRAHYWHMVGYLVEPHYYRTSSEGGQTVDLEKDRCSVEK